MRTDELLARGIVAETDCRYGRMRFLRTDIYIAQSLGFYGEFSEAEVALWRHFVRQGDAVVSAGANCGAHVVALARLVGAGGHVWTVEPQPTLYDLLVDNLEANALGGRVTHRRAALGAAPGTATMPRVPYEWPASFGSIEVDQAIEQTDAIAVDVVTIDDLVGDSDDRPVRMIQLDVEGRELEALHGARKTIAKWRPYLYLEADRKEKTADLVRTVMGMGYQVLQHAAPLYNPNNYAGQRLNLFPTTASISALGVPL